MDQEKLKIQRAFYDLIKELETLKDTNSAISDFKTNALEISDRLKVYLSANASTFERMSDHYEAYLRESERNINSLRKISEETHTEQKVLLTKLPLIEVMLTAINRLEESETVKNAEIIRNLKESQLNVHQTTEVVNEISHKLSEIENADASRNEEVVRNLKDTVEGLKKTRQGLKEISKKVSDVNEDIDILKSHFENTEKALKDTEDRLYERILTIETAFRNQRIWIITLGILNFILSIVIIALLCR